MSSYEPLFSEETWSLLQSGQGEIQPGQDGGIHDAVRDPGTKEIIDRFVFVPVDSVDDGANEGSTVAVVGAIIGAGAVVVAGSAGWVKWRVERRKTKKLEQQISELRQQLDRLTEKLQSADDADEAELQQQLEDTWGELIDLEEERAQRGQQAPSEEESGAEAE